MRCPGFALASSHAHPVQRRRDVLVRPLSRHAADHREGFIGRSATVLATFGFADTELGVLPASPMDRQYHIASDLIDIGDGVDDEGTRKPFPTPTLTVQSPDGAAGGVGMPMDCICAPYKKAVRGPGRSKRRRLGVDSQRRSKR